MLFLFYSNEAFYYIQMKLSIMFKEAFYCIQMIIFRTLRSSVYVGRESRRGCSAYLSRRG